MPMTATQVQQLYVAYFNRPADYLGQEYWKTQDATAAAKAFAASAEYAATYAGMDVGARVNAIYQNLFGHAADLPGLTYWSNQLQSGKLTIADVVVAVSNGAQGTDKAAYDAKVSAATAFTTALDTTAEVTGYSGTAANNAAKAWLAGINSAAQATAATATAALNATVTNVVSATSTAASVALTTATETLTGSSSNDVYTAVDASTDTQDTLNSGDSIDGGAGSDTLVLTMADNDAATLRLSSVETVSITATTAATLSAALWSGLQSVKVSDTGGNLVATTLVTVNDLKQNTTISLQNVGGNADGDDVVAVEFDAGGVGSSGTFSILSNGFGGPNADGGGTTYADIAVTANTNVFTALNITANGVTRLGVAAAAADDFDLQAITITGTGAVSFDASANLTITEINTVDASGATGGVAFRDTDNYGTAEDFTFTGGSGNDSVAMSVANTGIFIGGAGNDSVLLTASSATLTAADSIDGGAGTDELQLTSATAVGLDDGTAEDVSALARITNFERLRITDDLAADLVVGALGYNYISLGDDVSDGGGGATITLSGLTTGGTIVFRDNADMTDDLVVTMTGATGAGAGSDVLNLSFNANLGDQANAAAAIEYDLDINGIENLVITVADRANGNNATDVDDGYILDLVDNDDVLENITVSGTREFSYTSSATALSLEKIDASGLSGNLILDLDTQTAVQGILVKGGSGTNTINGSTAADSITGGVLADSITGDTGADSMTGNGGNDTFVIDQTADSEVTVSGTTVSGFDTITDFSAGDLVDLSAGTVAGAATAAAVAATSVQISAGGKVTFASADDTLAEMVTALAADDTNVANAEVAFFEFGGSTYIYGAGADTTAGADDFLVKLTGVTGYTTLAVDGNFAFSLS